MLRESPDIETSSQNYASRFSGAVGEYLLSVQEHAINRALSEKSFKTVLDIGGGHGQLFEYFLNQGCEVTVLGSDIS